MHRRPELGSSLLEILIAITILGIASAALLGGIATGTSNSNLHRQQADDDAVLVSAGEAVLDNALNPFVPCATTSTYNADPSRYPNFSWPNTPGAPWSASNVKITKVLWWDLTRWDDPDSIPAPLCPEPALSQCDSYINGLQQITVTVTHPNNLVAMSRTFTKTLPGVPAGCTA